MFYDDDLGTEIFFLPVCLISKYASVTINVYLYSIHLGIWNVTDVFQFPFNAHFDRHRCVCVCFPLNHYNTYTHTQYIYIYTYIYIYIYIHFLYNILPLLNRVYLCDYVLTVSNTLLL